MPSGIYIGPEEQFQGRRADLVIDEDIVRAQFDEGKLWETHSRINFPRDEWEIEWDTHPRCECHERDGSYTCDHCKQQGFYGHMEQPDEMPEM